MLWEVEIRPKEGFADAEARRGNAEFRSTASGVTVVRAARVYLFNGELGESDVLRVAGDLLTDATVEQFHLTSPSATPNAAALGSGNHLVMVLLKPGVMDPAAESVQ